MIRVNKYGNDMSREKQVESDISLFTGIGKNDKDQWIRLWQKRKSGKM